MAIQMKAIEQYFPVDLFITFRFLNEIVNVVSLCARGS